MIDHDPAGMADEGSASADVARARMVAGLRASGRVLTRQIQAAFASVPRHLFVPEMGQSAAYRDEAFVLKCGPDGIPVSSSSQPAMMAIMLEQLGLRRGDRVLEIGTGSGYNAAIMSVITGPEGKVVTVDIDAEIVERARSSLAAAGFGAVEVRCADGGYGDPDDAPFDRIIVTAGAWDLAPAWLTQLAAGGRLVLPLSIRGIELSVALDRTDGKWLSNSACRCGFVRMLGAFERPQVTLRLGGPDRVVVQLAEGSAVDADALELALAGPAVEIPTGVAVADQSELGDLDLWLTLTQPELERLTVLTSASTPRGQVLPLGGLASDPGDADRFGVATLLPDESAPWTLSRPGASVTVRGFGPGGPALATRLADRAGSWAKLARPGAADVRLTVWPPGTAVPPAPGMVVVNRPSARIDVGWPQASPAE